MKRHSSKRRFLCFVMSLVMVVGFGMGANVFADGTDASQDDTTTVTDQSATGTDDSATDENTDSEKDEAASTDTDATAADIVKSTSKGATVKSTTSGEVEITKLELYKGNPSDASSTLVADLLAGDTVDWEVGVEYYLNVEASKDAVADDCWVSIDMPYWMTPINMVGGTSWNQTGATTNHTALDKVVSFTAATGRSSTYNTGAGKVVYHISGSAEKAGFQVSMSPNWHYYNGSGSQTNSQKLVVECGDMNGESQGTVRDTDATSITRVSTGYKNIILSQISVPSGKIDTSISSGGYIGITDYDLPVGTSIEFTIDPRNADSIDSVSLRGWELESLGNNKYKATSTTGVYGYRGSYLAVTATWSGDAYKGTTQTIGITDIKFTTYGDEGDSGSVYVRTGSGSLSYRIQGDSSVSFAGVNFARYDWEGQQSIDNNNPIGTFNLAYANSLATDPNTDPYTIEVTTPSNALVRAITVPYFSGDAGTKITINGTEYNVDDVSYVVSGPGAAGYRVIRNTDLGLGKDDTISTVKYDVGPLVGGSTTYGGANGYYNYQRLGLWGEFKDGTAVTSTATAYKTATGSTSEDLTAESTVTPQSALNIRYNLGNGESSASMSNKALVAGESTTVTSCFRPASYLSGAYGTSGYLEDPTIYLYLPDGFDYSSMTIEGTPVTGVDVTSSATGVPTGMKIIKFDTSNVKAGVYLSDGTINNIDVKFTLITEKSASAGTFNITQFLRIGNDSYPVNASAGVADVYGVNGGRLMATQNCSFTVQELKAVTIDNSMRVSADDGATWTNWLKYEEADPNNTRAFINTGMIGEYKVDITNQTGEEVKDLEVFIPVAEAGQNFGEAFHSGDQEFDLTFEAQGVPTGYSVEYLKMNTGVSYDQGEVPDASDYTVVSDPSQADMIRIKAPGTVASDAPAVTVTFSVYNANGNGTTPKSFSTASTDYGKINTWNCVPRYTVGTSEYVPKGYPEAIEIAGGVMKGTVYEDANGNGVMDSGESGIKDVTVTDTDTYSTPRTMTTTTDANGEYTFLYARNQNDASIQNKTTTTTGNKPSVVTTTDDDQTASKSGLAAVGATPVVTDAGLANIYTIDYAAGTNGTIGTPASEEVGAGSSPSTVPVTHPSDGYEFAGWTLDKGVKAKEAITVGSTTYAAGDTIPAGTKLTSDQLKKITVTENLKATAQFSPKDDTAYKVEHYKQKLDGTYELADTDDLTGTTDTTATAVAKTYTGFSENTTHTSRVPSGNIDGDGSLVLKLYYDRNKYALTYNGNGNTGGTAPTDSSSPYMYGATATVLGNTGSLAKTGATFTGWNTKADGTGTAYAAGDTFAISGTTVLYAQYKTNEYTITYKAGTKGDFADDVHANVAHSTNTPAFAGVTETNGDPKGQAGYLFNGWSPTVATTVTGPATYTATWKPATDTKYKVEHYKQKLDGTYELADTDNLTGTTDTTATASSKTYTGFTENTTIASRVPSGNIDGDGSLVLKLYYDRDEIKVVYDGNGNESGTAPTDSSNPYMYQETVTVLGNTGNLAKTGYDFTGWNTKADGSGTAYASASTFTAEVDAAGAAVPMTLTNDTITLYAQYTKQTYTITFDSKGGNYTPSNQTVSYGDQVSKPTAPTKAGFTFDGWYYTDASGKLVKWNFGDPVTGPMTLIAQWSKINTPGTVTPVSKDKNASTGDNSAAMAGLALMLTGLGAIVVLTRRKKG